MNLPFDLEDILGAALADVFKRMLLFVTCILAALLCTHISLCIAGIIAKLAFITYYGSSKYNIDWMLILKPFSNGMILLYAPVVLPVFGVAARYFTRAEEPSVKWWVVFFFLLSLGMTLPAVAEPGGNFICGIAFALLLGFAASVFGLFRFWGNHQYRKSEEHLMGVAMENEMRRQEKERSSEKEESAGMADSADEPEAEDRREEGEP